MSDQLKDWGLQLFQKYGITLIGFTFAAYIYADWRDYMHENLQVLQDVSRTTAIHTETIRTLTQNVERLIDKQQPTHNNTK